jgi:uncharacterized phage protein (TIGR02220 family)
MPRIRTIKPEFWDDEKLARAVCRDARLLYIGLWNYADDYGVVRGNPNWLKGKIFPYEEIKMVVFEGWLKELESANCIKLFHLDGETYYHIRAFKEHQTINRPSSKRNPEYSLNTHEPLIEPSVSPQCLKGEGEGELEREEEQELEGERERVNPDKIPYQEILDHLNQILIRHNPKKSGFRPTDRTKSWINARWGEGYRLEDFQYVHTVKVKEWLGDQKMEKFLCPETLYSPKFEKYRNQTIPGDAPVLSELTRHNLEVGRQWLEEHKDDPE